MSVVIRFCRSLRILLPLRLFVVLGCCWPTCAWSQPTEEDRFTAQRDFQLELQFTSAGGAYTYVPEKWGELQLTLRNGLSAERDLVCATSFDVEPGLQYGRRIWLPALSKLRIGHPIRIPKCDPQAGRNLTLNTLAIDVAAREESLVKSEGGLLKHDAALLVTHELRNTGFLGTLPGPYSPPNLAAELVTTCRVERRWTNKLVWFTDAFLPSDAAGLETLDQLVIADDRLLNDFAAMSAVRQWLHAGGRLWVMLDIVDPAVLESLLGDDFNGQVIDRVGLTTVRIDKAPVLSEPETQLGEMVVYEEPVEFVRLLAPDLDAVYLVNGWPAALTKACGDGKLLITTLGARGWMKPKPDGTGTTNDPQFVSGYLPVPPMADFASHLFSPRQPAPLPAAAIEPLVREYIGYGVLSWRLVVGTLLAFSLSIVILGVWLLRTDRLEHLAWIGSALAITASLFLVWQGRMNRRESPATIASLQLIQSLRGTDDLRSEGTIAVYQPEGSDFPIAATRGGRLLPDMTGLEGTTRRLVTTDLGASHWENLRQSAGIRSATFERAETVPNRLEARATFDRQGITGKYQGALPPGTDALIATDIGRLGVTLASDGAFVGRANDVFEADQFLGAGLLSDEQDRRRRLLRRLLTNPKRHDYPVRPQLMFWSEPEDNGFQFGEGLQARGAALVAVPLIIDRPATGTEIVIPSPLLNYVNRRNPDGSIPSPMWNPSQKEWQERATPGLNWLSFQVPRELLPLAARRALLNLKVSGPIGRVEVLGLKQGNSVSLQTVTNPVGSLAIDLTDAEALTLDDEGRLALGISAGVAARPAATPNSAGHSTNAAKLNYWRIESLTLQLWATTTEPTAKD